MCDSAGLVAVGCVRLDNRGPPSQDDVCQFTLAVAVLRMRDGGHADGCGWWRCERDPVPRNDCGRRLQMRERLVGVPRGILLPD